MGRLVIGGPERGDTKPDLADLSATAGVGGARTMR